MEHTTYMGTRRTGSFGGGPLYFGRCHCGWEGPSRSDRSRAVHDCDNHLERPRCPGGLIAAVSAAAGCSSAQDAESTFAQHVSPATVPLPQQTGVIQMDSCPECGNPRIDYALDGRAMCVNRHLWVSDDTASCENRTP